MKKFSFLLVGALLLWTITFALAEETKALTGSVAEMLNSEPVTLTAEATDTETVEATTWDTVEATDADTVEATTLDAETTWDTTEVDETTAENTDETTAENTDTTTPTDVDTTKEKYGEEQVAAYEWALEKWITTINDIEKARLTDGLTRAELAKMMSQYMTKVLWKTPAETEKVEYADVNESLWDLADFIQTAYAYKIMGINADETPLKNFNPNGKVTRAEYATVFSRVLFGDKYNKSEWNYYEDHLNALKDSGILTNTTPTIQEVRGWVMLMMYRSTNAKTETTDEEPTVWMPNPASVYCEAQGWTVNSVKDEEGNESGMCKLADGTEVDEWEYYRANHSTEEATWTTAPLYSEEDLNAAKAVITETVNGWEVKVESFTAEYAVDETANNNLEYCKSLNSEVTECAVFTSSFHIPEQAEGVQMAWAFEPNTDMNGWTWYLGRTAGGTWTVLTNGLD